MHVIEFACTKCLSMLEFQLSAIVMIYCSIGAAFAATSILTACLTLIVFEVPQLLAATTSASPRMSFSDLTARRAIFCECIFK